MPLLTELHGIIDSLAADPAARAVIVQGNGPAWCAGADIKGSEGDEDLSAHPLVDLPFWRLTPKPVSVFAGVTRGLKKCQFVRWT